MQFPNPRRRPQTENLVPMINVVFLLLIFFLMTAQVTPPEPFPVAPPSSESSVAAEGAFTLYLDAQGQLGYADHTGQAPALAALAADLDSFCTQGGCSEEVPPPPLLLRADGAVPADRLATLLPLLGQAGFAQVHLVTVHP